MTIKKECAIASLKHDGKDLLIGVGIIVLAIIGYYIGLFVVDIISHIQWPVMTVDIGYSIGVILILAAIVAFVLPFKINDVFPHISSVFVAIYLSGVIGIYYLYPYSIYQTYPSITTPIILAIVGVITILLSIMYVRCHE